MPFIQGHGSKLASLWKFDLLVCQLACSISVPSNFSYWWTPHVPHCGVGHYGKWDGTLIQHLPAGEQANHTFRLSEAATAFSYACQPPSKKVHSASKMLQERSVWRNGLHRGLADIGICLTEPYEKQLRFAPKSKTREEELCNFLSNPLWQACKNQWKVSLFLSFLSLLLSLSLSLWREWEARKLIHVLCKQTVPNRHKSTRPRLADGVKVSQISWGFQ